MQKNTITDTEVSIDANSVTLSAWLGALKIIFWNKFMRLIYVGTIILMIAQPISEHLYWHLKTIWALPIFWGGMAWESYYQHLFNKERA
jgi:hypothetical protein